jgi:hypothetical protein
MRPLCDGSVSGAGADELFPWPGASGERLGLDRGRHDGLTGES